MLKADGVKPLNVVFFVNMLVFFSGGQEELLHPSSTTALLLAGRGECQWVPPPLPGTHRSVPIIGLVGCSAPKPWSSCK